MRARLFSLLAALVAAVGGMGDASGGRRTVHVVETGDSLWTISRRYDCTVDELRRANKLSSNEIRPGDELRVPKCQEASAAPTPAQPARDRYVIVAGDTLGKIAKAHGCTVDELRRTNKLSSNEIRPGDELRLPSCEDRTAATTKLAQLPIGNGLVSHVVVSGDTLGKIARQYDSSVEHIRHANKLKDNIIKPGQVLAVQPGVGGRGSPILGQSVGRPQHGQLVRGTELGRSNAYYRRRMSRIYGTNYVVHRLRTAIELVAKRHPRAHKLAVGDLSAPKGGAITEHVSHQSGRDVDLGFYFKRKPNSYPEAFVEATEANLDFDATWDLLTTLAASKESDGGVLVMYISYPVQGMLYRMAKERGVPPKILSQMLQYPRGEDALAGMVRHEPGHEDHIHVRFKCPEADKGCE